MAEKDWLLREFARASEQFDELPLHSRPIVTRTWSNGRRPDAVEHTFAESEVTEPGAARRRS
jgi:hypothetical protein